MPKDDGLVGMFERAVKNATAQLVSTYEDALGELGPRPAGFEQADVLDRLEHFLDTCADPQGWQRVILETAQQEGSVERAEALCVRAAGNLLRMLARRGGGGRVPDDPDDFQRAVNDGAVAVQHAQLVKRLQSSERTLREAEKLNAAPAAWVVNVPAPVDLTQQMLMGQEAI